MVYIILIKIIVHYSDPHCTSDPLLYIRSPLSVSISISISIFIFKRRRWRWRRWRWRRCRSKNVNIATPNFTCLWKSISSKYRRSGVPTWGLPSRRISKLCNLSRVEAELQNWKIEVEYRVEYQVEYRGEYWVLSRVFKYKSWVFTRVIVE